MTRPRPAYERAAALALAMGLGLAVAGCGDGGAKPEARPPQRYVWKPPPPRVATHLPADFSQWTKVLALQHAEMTELQAKLAEKQEIHLANRFDEFLQADPATLNADQAATLWHFADKGYFTVERRIVRKLLQDRLAENDPHLQPGAAPTVAERAALLAKQNELKLRDLRAAAEMYEKTHQGEFHLPQPANAEQLEALRGLARGKLEEARREAAALDAEIKELQTKLNGPSLN